VTCELATTNLPTLLCVG